MFHHIQLSIYTLPSMLRKSTSLWLILIITALLIMAMFNVQAVVADEIVGGAVCLGC